MGVRLAFKAITTGARAGFVTIGVRRAGRTAAAAGAARSNVDDDAVRVVDGVDAVGSSAIQVEHHPGSRIQLTTDAHLPDRAVGERDGRVLQGVGRTCVREVDEDARRALDALVVKRDFAIELQGDTERIGQHLTPDLHGALPASRHRGAAASAVDGAERAPKVLRRLRVGARRCTTVVGGGAPSSALIRADPCFASGLAGKRCESDLRIRRAASRSAGSPNFANASAASIASVRQASHR